MPQDYPKWVQGGGVMQDGEEAGKKLDNLFILVESKDEESAVKTGKALLTHVKAASEDVLGIQIKR